MKKKIAMLSCLILVFAMLLGGCGTDPTTVDYNGYSYDDLYSSSSTLIDNLAAMTDEYVEYYLENGDPLTVSIVESWSENTADLGEYTGYGEEDFTITKSGSTLTTDMMIHFEKRDVDFQIVYNYYDMSTPTGVTVEPVQSLGEKMSKAGLNTIISMVIVFAVLILISLIIYAFNIFPYLEKKKKEKAAAADPQPQTAPVAAVPEVSRSAEVPEDDTELIAVIAAAIAASTGTSASDFVVRSINRR